MTATVRFPAGFAFDDWIGAPLAAPFAPSTVGCLAALSDRLVRDAALRPFPELTALGFWLRRGNLQHLQQRHLHPNRLHRPLGSVLHLTPGNVDTLFLYSGAISLLMGNRNLFRLSRRNREGQDRLIKVLQSLYSEPQWRTVLNRFVIADFPHDRNLLEQLCCDLDLRITWGGNATVQQVRTIPLAARARDIAFADKFSLCLLNARAVLEADSLTELLREFRNDAYMFGQQACASPRAVIWLGEDATAAQARFWKALETVLQADADLLTSSEQMDSLVAVQQLAAEGLTNRIDGIQSPWIKRAPVSSLNAAVEAQHVGGGLFFELQIGTLDELLPQLRPHHQTLTFWGIPREDILTWLKQTQVPGLDRVCPVGRALDFEGYWDGINLFSAFSRQMFC